MTPTQKRLIETVRAELKAGRWTPLEGGTIRWMRELPTPADYPKAWWDGPTYHQILFLSVVAPTGSRWSIILGRCASPAGGRTDSMITFKRAFEILAHPEGEFG